MSTNPVEMGVSGGRKANFSLTCSLLSLYLKQKGGFGELGLEMTATRPSQDGKGKSEPLRTINLLPGIDTTPGREPAQTVAEPRNTFQPPQPAPVDFAVKKPSMAESRQAPMTIFYGGKVIVFNNFPAEKAKELMAMASKGVPNHTVNAPKLVVASAPAAAAAPTQVLPQGTQHLSIASADLPIMRRVSLNRFLEKRKDRVSSKAPYQVNGGSTPTPATTLKPEESLSWLGLGSLSASGPVANEAQ